MSLDTVMNSTQQYHESTDVMTNTTTLSYALANVTSDDVINTTSAVTQTVAARLSGFVDTATKDMVVEVVNCYLLPVVVVLGVCGNLMSLVVLLVHGMSSSTNVLLLGLTSSDLGFLLTMYARKVSCIVSKFDYLMSRRIEVGLLPTVYMVNRIFGLCTPFLTMLITLERCLAVSLPFKVGKLVTPRRMAATVIGVYVFSAAAIVPFFLIYTVKWMPDRATGELIPRLAGTPFYYRNLETITAYNNIALAGLFYFGPMFIVVLCTVFIIVTLQRSSQWRKTVTTGGKEEERMTRMLMAVVVVYLCMYIPGGAIGIANQASPDFGSLGGRYNNLFYLVGALQLLLYACNSSCNFVIYMFLSSKFYNTYLRIFLCRKQKKKATSSSKPQCLPDSAKVTVTPSTQETSIVHG